MSIDKITFTKATFEHKDIIFAWLQEPHMQEFWDMTQGHKDDIIKFMNGRIEPSDYCDGKYVYWLGMIDNQPYSLIMSIKEDHGEEGRPLFKEKYLSKTGATYGLDFCIGNTEFLNKGLAAPTLKTFTEFFIALVDKDVDTFLIDPYDDNPKAKHVYLKAGFKLVGEFVMDNGTLPQPGSSGKTAYLLVKNMK